MSFLLSRRPSLPVPLPSDRPGPSILLNPEESSDIPRSPRSPRSPRRPPSNDGRSPAASTSSLTSSSPSTSSKRPAPLTATASSTKVSFAPLPEVPPELKRRSSITLGVAARKNLLSGGPIRSVSNGRIVERQGGTTVYMSDEEWAEYKATHFPNQNQAIDVGEVAKSSAKSLWRRVRSGSLTQETAPRPVFLGLSNPPQSPRRGLRPVRRNTDPTMSPPSPSIACRLDGIEEESKSLPGVAVNQVIQEHHTRFAPWANKSPDSIGRRKRQPRAEDEGSDDEGSGQDTPTPKVWVAPPESHASREKDRAILGFDKLALDKNFGGHFGV